MKHTLVFIISLLFVWQLYGQDEGVKERSQRLHLSYGQMYSLKIDKTYSRLAKQGFAHQFDLAYERQKNDYIYSVQSEFRLGKLNSNGNEVNVVTDVAADFRLRYLRRVKQIEVPKLSIYSGVNTIFRSDIWFPPEHTLRYAWDIHLGLGLAGAMKYNINPKMQIRYDLDLSLLGILWRSHNNGQQLVTEETQLENGTYASAFETPRFAYLLNTFYFDHSVKLQYAVSEKIDLYYNLSLSYLYIKQPLVKKGYQISNLVGMVIHLGKRKYELPRMHQ